MHSVILFVRFKQCYAKIWRYLKRSEKNRNHRKAILTEIKSKLVL